MSASPSGLSSGRTPTPKGGPPQFVRKPRPADPLRPRQKPKPRPSRPAASSAPAAARTNGIYPASGNAPSKATSTLQANVAAKPASSKGGWTAETEGPYQDFPLVTTKKALREHLRYHVARFSAKRDVDPSNQDEFPRPVSLHRRDPRQPPPGKAAKEEEPEPTIDDKEREKQEIAKQEKEAQRAADQALIAPTVATQAAASKKKKGFRHEKTTQVRHFDNNEEEKAASDLRYEEALPWHLEDADNKGIWVGNYEAALSGTNIIMVRDKTRYMMIPIEKWYKFTPKNQFKTLTIEEAEAQMNKKTKESRWFMKTQEQQLADQETQATRRKLGNLYTVKSESNTFRNSGKREMADMDDLDFEDDLFADDEEHTTVDKDRDEDTKDAEEKIKREQLGANLFGEANEEDVEKELLKEEKEEEERKRLGKGVKKALQKREKNYIYDSDSDHPYSSSSDDSSDSEKLKEEQKKKEGDPKNATAAKPDSSSKLPSGASSKGNNTPSGRPRHSNPLGSNSNNRLKRPGSPNLSASEASGNESSRKKHKKKHGSGSGGSAQGTRTSTPTPGGSRPMSPQPSSGGAGGGGGGGGGGGDGGSGQQQPLQRKSSIIKLPVPASRLNEIRSTSPNPATSDGEATGGEMSDGMGGRRKKIRIGGGGVGGNRSPGRGENAAGGARSGSAGAGGSRAGSPAASQAPIRRFSAAEIKAALPEKGITIVELCKLFHVESNNLLARKAFIAKVKDIAAFDSTTKLLRAKK